MTKAPVRPGQAAGVFAGRSLKSGGLFRLLFQACQIVGESGSPVLHKDEPVLDPGDLVKSQIREELCSIALGIEKEIQDPPLILVVHQVADDDIHQALTLMRGVYRHAAESIFKAGAGGSQVVVVVKQACAVVQIPVPPDALFFEKRFHLADLPSAGRMDPADMIFRHGNGSFLSDDLEDGCCRSRATARESGLPDSLLILS